MLIHLGFKASPPAGALIFAEREGEGRKEGRAQWTNKWHWWPHRFLASWLRSSVELVA